MFKLSERLWYSRQPSKEGRAAPKTRREFGVSLSAIAFAGGLASCRQHQLTHDGLMSDRLPGTTKRFVVCLDGTWADYDASTNIWWIRTQCATPGVGPMLQDIIYVRGVGTHYGERYRGGVFGYMLDRQILSAYEGIFVGGNWRAGDELFIFGFSRGAMAARSLSNFIGSFGPMRDPSEIQDAYSDYRAGGQLKTDGSVEVKFLGVFDTVSALGWSGIVPWDNPSYHKIEIGRHVRHAYHAVALDEVQSSFRAQLWDTKAIIRNGTLHCEQLWFAGGHGDVGGGHPDAKEDPTALARVPLLWMMERANEVALAEPGAKATPLLRPEALEELRKADYLAPQHSLPPNIGPIAGALMRDVPRQVPSQDRMHQAAADRIGKLVEVRSSDGEPEGPKVHYRPVAGYTGEA